MVAFGKRKLVFLGILLLIVVGLIVVSISNREGEVEEVEPKPTGLPATPTVIYEQSKTGALYISPTKEERIVGDSIRILRDECPVETNDFVLDFDYKRFTFVVKTNNEDSFWMWLDENGYIIPVEDFVIEK